MGVELWGVTLGPGRRGGGGGDFRAGGGGLQLQVEVGWEHWLMMRCRRSWWLRGRVNDRVTQRTACSCLNFRCGFDVGFHVGGKCEQKFPNTSLFACILPERTCQDDMATIKLEGP
jgi:hypothetical protein